MNDDAKPTIEMVMNLNNYEKVRSLHPDQMFGSDDISLLIHSGNTKDKKATMEIFRQKFF